MPAMPTNVAVPNLGESVAEATLIKWHKADGELVKTDEPLCELETDKANVDVPSPATGVLKRNRKAGETVKIGDSIASIDPDGKPMASSSGGSSSGGSSSGVGGDGAAKPPPLPTAAAAGGDPSSADAPKPAATTPAAASSASAASGAAASGAAASGEFSPAVTRMLAEHRLDPKSIPATGPGGRVTKEDIVNYLEQVSGTGPGATDVEPVAAAQAIAPRVAATPPAKDGEGVRRTPMSKIRKRIAENLVKAQQTAALLTTFNEVDMSAVMDLRSRYKESFEKQHGIGLGFMGFFVRACCAALKEFPRVNGQIDGDDLLLFDHVHMGIAVSTDRGLAVPVLKNADQMSFAKVESEIKRVAIAVRDGKLGLQELSGGTFTITNGGVFGSLLSTPIINAPQSAILGMHKIEQRAVVVNNQIVIRPMMYLALSYDHRMIDGKESVSFLVKVKEYLEDPARMLIGI
jgi:2-oxoglutarate dehydrogenase E2 component (dihydrolipoamide succinyltransferase)